MTAAAGSLPPDSARERAALHAVDREDDLDPLGPTLALGAGSERLGFALGVAGAMLLHFLLMLGALTALLALSNFADGVRAAVLERLRTTYEIDETPPPPPPPEPTAAAEPTAPPPPPTAAPPAAAPKATEPPPPAAAQAGKVLTAPPDPDEPLDLTGNTFVTGDADRYAGGTTAASGTSKQAVYDPNAGKGTPGGSGNGPPQAAPAAPTRDLSRAPTPVDKNWSCPFPPEADQDQVDYAAVTLVVTVGPNGRARSVSVLSDPGHGFGRMARQCAMSRSYNVGLDKTGQATTRTTPPITVRFNR